MTTPSDTGAGGPAPVALVPQPALPPTMAQTLAGLATRQQTLDGTVRGALAALPPSPAVDAVTAALDTLATRRATAGALGAFADRDVGDAHYQAVGRFRSALSDLVTALGGVPALDPALTLTATGQLADCRALAAQMLLLITALHTPRVGYPSVGFEYELPYVQVETQLPAKTLIARWMNGDEEDVRLDPAFAHGISLGEPAGSADVDIEEFQ